jgi:spoIIIJ-associated protein
MSEQSATTQEQPATDVSSPDPSTEPSTESTPVSEAASGTDSSESSDSSETSASSETSETRSDEAANGSLVARLEREGEVAADFLEQLLDIADLDGDLDVDVDGDRAAVAIVDSEEGRVPRRLVGDHAKVLEALQELTRLAVQAATGERSRLMLDVAGYRAERRAALVEAAGTAIEQVRSSGESTTLEPMTAFERKVVHDEVLAAGLSSESEGVEPHRCVVILPR